MSGLLAVFALLITTSEVNAKDFPVYKLNSTISPINAPEDLIRIPKTDWIIASSMAVKGSPGHLFAFKISGEPELNTLFPTNKTSTVTLKPAITKYPQPDPKVFFPTGINLVRLKKDKYRLFVINHGGREAVELFDLNIDEKNRPSLQWHGCIPLSKNVFANGIVSLDGDSFMITNSYDLADKHFLKKFDDGIATGGILKWTSRGGWQSAAKHTFCGANGIEISSDKQWLFVAEWGIRRLWKLSLNGHCAAQQIELDFLPDNLRWSDDGKLLVAGQIAKPSEVWGCVANNGGCPMKFAVAEIDPVNFKSQSLLISGDRDFGSATVAIKTRSDLWVGSFRGKKIARYSKLFPNTNKSNILKRSAGE